MPYGRGTLRNAIGRDVSPDEEEYRVELVRLAAINWDQPWITAVEPDLAPGIFGRSFEATGILAHSPALERIFGAMPPARIGRPVEYDWPRVKKMAAEESARGRLGVNKKAEVLLARYLAEIGAPPSLSMMKQKLREWATKMG